ncbi:MAG: hypothetical protein HXN93_03120 [Prevotella pleuritidis]|nr:hypothetical protein [Hoylesella pleuritidis]
MYFNYFARPGHEGVCSAPNGLDTYQRTLTDYRYDSVKGPFISLYKTDGKLFIEFPPAFWGGICSSVSNPQMGESGFKNTSLVHIRFVGKDSSVVM